MSRQEATNTFTEGMIMDLNPLTTPDSVLTDCLNGTLLTYNDNEFILQNDQGNYKLKNGKLDPNYIPIGIKEYGNILYIVSYNPIDQKVEIGSYPAPQTIFQLSDTPNKTNLNPIVSKEILDNPVENLEYLALTENAELFLFSNPSAMNTYLLNPNDEYKFEIESDTTLVIEDFPYQGLQLYVMDQNKKLNLLEDLQITNMSDFERVSWNIPGWLTAKYRLADIDKFNLNIKEINIPDFVSGANFNISSLILNAQFEITDVLFNNLDSTKNDLQVYYKIELYDKTGAIKKVDNTELRLEGYQSDLIKSQYGEKLCIYTTNINLNDTIKTWEIESNDKLKISAIPVLKYATKDEETFYIEYKQFEQTQEIKLDTQNASEIVMGNYIYYVTDKSINITFNLNGAFRVNSALSAEYIIYDIDKNSILEGKVNDLNIFGQNVITIDFNDTFVAENIYILSLNFISNDITVHTINKILITSKTFNAFRTEYSDFNNINADIWLNENKNLFEVIQAPILNSEVDSSNGFSGDILTNLGETTDLKQDLTNLFPITYSYKNGGVSLDPIQFKIYRTGTQKYKLTGKLKYLTGPLWQGQNPTSVLNYSVNGNIYEVADLELNDNLELDSDVTLNLESSKTLQLGFYRIVKNKYISKPTKEYLKDIINVASKLGLTKSDYDDDGNKIWVSQQGLDQKPDLMGHMYFRYVNNEDWDITTRYHSPYTFDILDAFLKETTVSENAGGLHSTISWPISGDNWLKNADLNSYAFEKDDEGNITKVNSYGDGLNSSELVKLYNIMDDTQTPIVLVKVINLWNHEGQEDTNLNGAIVSERGFRHSTVPFYFFMMRNIKKKVNGITDKTFKKLTTILFPKDIAQIMNGTDNHANITGVEYYNMFVDLCDHLFVVTKVDSGSYDVYSPADNITISEKFNSKFDYVTLNLKFENNPKFNGEYDLLSNEGLLGIQNKIKSQFQDLNFNNFILSGKYLLTNLPETQIQIQNPISIIDNNFSTNENVVNYTSIFETVVKEQQKGAQQELSDLEQDSGLNWTVGELKYDGTHDKEGCEEFIKNLKIVPDASGNFSMKNLYLNDTTASPLHVVGVQKKDDDPDDKLFAFTTENSNTIYLPKTKTSL